MTDGQCSIGSHLGTLPIRTRRDQFILIKKWRGSRERGFAVSCQRSRSSTGQASGGKFRQAPASVCSIQCRCTKRCRIRQEQAALLLPRTCDLPSSSSALKVLPRCTHFPRPSSMMPRCSTGVRHSSATLGFNDFLSRQGGCRVEPSERAKTRGHRFVPFAGKFHDGFISGRDAALGSTLSSADNLMPATWIPRHEHVYLMANAGIEAKPSRGCLEAGSD